MTESRAQWEDCKVCGGDHWTKDHPVGVTACPVCASGDIEHRRAEGMDLPRRIVVDANGNYWRDYGDHYSMPPVSDDNEPVKPAAVYEPQTAEERHRLAADWLDHSRFREAYWLENSTPLIRRVHPEYRARSDQRADNLLYVLAHMVPTQASDSPEKP